MLEQKLFVSDVELQNIKTNGDSAFIPSYSTEVPDTWNIIYKSNADKIGLLPTNDAKKIITFYALIDTLIINLKPNSMHNTNGMTQEVITAYLEIAKEAVMIGEGIVRAN